MDREQKRHHVYQELQGNGGPIRLMLWQVRSAHILVKIFGVRIDVGPHPVRGPVALALVSPVREASLSAMMTLPGAANFLRLPIEKHTATRL